MSESLLDKSLDEIIGSSRPRAGAAPRGPRRGPSSGVSKPHQGGSKRGGIRRPRRHVDSYTPSESSGLMREVEDLSRGEPYLKVTNLNPEITEQDVNALFEQVADVAFCRLSLDTQGNSRGVAFIGFVNPANNELAVEKFDGRRAAGQVITVRDTARKSRGPNPLLERLGSSTKRDTRAPKKSKPKKKTAEELDAELDNYFQDSSNEPLGDPNPPFPAV